MVAEGQPPSAVPLVFVDDLALPQLSTGDAHHLGRVLRVRPQSPLTLADGSGAWCAGVFTGAGVEATGEPLVAPQRTPLVGVGFALTKSDKPELVVQKLTELGVDRIVAFVAARSVVQWDDAKRARQHERWQVVAREAAMQCRRARLPLIEPITTFAEVSRREGCGLAMPNGDPPSLELPLVLVGPEGGFTEDEAAALPHVGLGEHVLRAETAAIAAGALLVALRSGMVQGS